ncbi:hypothetical protein FGG08_003276 [Glutinoglossum americanum]|uniref:Uncharacterized protein n=1 Tax=Glutinoglossum americanum TaxID=1670608 RepID=A0A9P8L0U2_9PEZI|nr:hypothetical protein FGG08_003276 [Glutinoglossum americanum]
MSYTVAEPLPSVPATNYIHGGRGGAGNYRRVDPTKSASAPLPTSRPISIDSHRSTASGVYSCGRGGAGNMHAGSERAIFSFDEEIKRERVREEGAAPIYHVGRGGAGNFAKRDGGDDNASRYSSESTRSGIEQLWGKLSGTFSRS